jgi:Hemerythrin HHE cation binding domain
MPDGGRFVTTGRFAGHRRAAKVRAMTAPDDTPSSLRAATSDHHARLLPHVDRLLILAEMVGQVECASLHALFDEEYRFIVGQLVPHMEVIERTLYGRLETLMDGRHSMAPMREEHHAVRRLIDELGRYREHAEGCSWSAVEGLALRRALYRLHALLKVHLAEEELYLGVLDRKLTAAEKEQLARGIDHAMTEPL